MLLRLGHHLFHIPQVKAVGQIPPDAQNDHFPIEVPTLKHPSLRLC